VDIACFTAGFAVLDKSYYKSDEDLRFSAAVIGQQFVDLVGALWRSFRSPRRLYVPIPITGRMDLASDGN
jgi:hypothetical protein